MNYLGVDIGTSVCKAVVFDENGKKIAHSQMRYDVIFTADGGAELNSNEVMEKCFMVIKEAAAEVEKESIAGLGISAQGEAFTAVDSKGKILNNAMVSSDTRADKYIVPWVEKFGEEKLYQITGQTVHPMYTLFKLQWLKENKPQVWKKADKFLCFEDLLQYHLGVDPAISWSLAGRTMMFDVMEHRWSESILDTIELPSEKLARPLASGSIAGRVNGKIAKELGLSKKAFIVTAGHDQPCAALGAGVTKAGLAIYTCGTVECITPCLDKPVFSERLQENNFCVYDHVLENKYVTLAYSLTGGNILKWFRTEFAYKEKETANVLKKDPYELIVKNMDKNPTDLMVLPNWVPGGTPHFDINTKGAILGFRLSTKRGEVIRALIEGVAMQMRLNLDILEKSGLNIDMLRIVGGGAKSEELTQLKASVLGKTITTLQVKETGCYGAAMLACSAYTKESADVIADSWVKIVSEINPNEKERGFYDEKFAKYVEVYPKIKDIII